MIDGDVLNEAPTAQSGEPAQAQGFEDPWQWSKAQADAAVPHADVAARKASKRNKMVVWLELVLHVLLLVPSAIFWLPRQVMRERRFDREARGPADLSNHALQLRPEQAPVVVIPLADLQRKAEDEIAKGQHRWADQSLSAELVASWPAQVAKNFVLLTAVLVDTAEISPILAHADSNHPNAVRDTSDTVTVLPQFVTDFASIPPIVSHFYPPAARYGRAAIFHDWAYAYHRDGSRSGQKHCDNAMLNIMRSDAVKPHVRAMVYVALRLFGALPYRSAPDRRRKLEKLAPLLHPYFLTIAAFTMAHFVSRFTRMGVQMIHSRDELLEAAQQDAAIAGLLDVMPVESVQVALGQADAQMARFGRVYF